MSRIGFRWASNSSRSGAIPHPLDTSRGKQAMWRTAVVAVTSVVSGPVRSSMKRGKTMSDPTQPPPPPREEPKLAVPPPTPPPPPPREEPKCPFPPPPPPTSGGYHPAPPPRAGATSRAGQPADLGV